MGLIIAVFVFATLIWAAVEGAAVIGLFAALTGERFERCRRCGRFGLTADHMVHPDGCPKPALQQFRRSRTALLHVVHRQHLSS